MKKHRSLLLLLGLLLSGPGCSGISSDYKEGVIKDVNTETGEITIDTKSYVIASKAWIHGEDPEPIKRMYLESGMKIKFKTTQIPKGDGVITEIKLNKNNSDFERPS